MTLINYTDEEINNKKHKRCMNASNTSVANSELSTI